MTDLPYIIPDPQKAIPEWCPLPIEAEEER